MGQTIRRSGRMTRRNANHKLALAVRLGLIAASATGSGVHASDTVNQETALENVLVTGSRIATGGLGSPLMTVTSDDIDSTGVVNVQDFLLQYPVFGTPEISRTNSNFRTDSAGVATIDLRNLGAARTLVLVNGRRFVAGIPGESAVDLNTIPQQLIERIEVLTGGASAVYGSDAVAGVVNIIYKRDFEGLEIDAQYGSSAEGDDEQYQVNLTVGMNAPDGRGNFVAHAAYVDQGAVYSRDRNRSAIDQVSLGAFTGQAADMFTAIRPFYSSFAPQGRFCTDVPCGDENSFTYDASNNLIPGFSTNGSETRAADGFDRSPYRFIAMPIERYLLATQGNYEFADGQRAFLEGTYASSQATNELEPFPFDTTSVYPDTQGWVPVEFEAFIDDPDNPGTAVRTVLRNPLVPEPIYDATVDRTGDGLRDLFVTRRLSEVGNRGNVAHRDTFQLVAGFQGVLPALKDWEYEAFYAFGQTEEAQTSAGQFNVLTFRSALEVVPDVDDVDHDGDRSEAICRDASARAQGCVPANPFGRGALSQAAVEYIAAPGSKNSSIEQKVAALNLSGSPLELAAGPLGVALGVEYRNEYARSDFDALQQSGLNGSGGRFPSSEGSFDAVEGYIEANVPIVAGLPFADSLQAWAAYRYSDYSTVGTIASWNMGLEWAPSSQIRVRGTRSRATRAPNITELFLPPFQYEQDFLADPCEGVTLVSAGETDDRCRAAPGVLDNILSNVDPVSAPDGVFTVSDADLSGIDGIDIGDPTLSEETGDSWTVGVVITPMDIEALRNISLTIDYASIEIAGAIALLPPQYSLDQCYSGLESYCALITRRPSAAGAQSAGSLDLVISPFANSGGLVSENIDATVSYAQDLAEWGLVGRLNVKLMYTHVLDAYIVPIEGARRDALSGEVGHSDDRANLALGYSLGDVDVTWRVNYIGPASLDDQFLLGFDLEPDSVGIGSTTYHDVQVVWSRGDTYEVYVGASNLFDEEPPPIINFLPGTSLGTETDAGTYDAIGRRFYGGVRVKF